MRLADAGRPEQQQRLAVRHPAAGGKLADLPGIERGLGGEVEAVQLAHRREMRDLARHLDATLVPAGDLALAQERQRLAQGQLLARRFVQQVVELVADRGQLQPGQPAGQRWPVRARITSLPRSPARTPPADAAARWWHGFGRR